MLATIPFYLHTSNFSSYMRKQIFVKFVPLSGVSEYTQYCGPFKTLLYLAHFHSHMKAHFFGQLKIGVMLMLNSGFVDTFKKSHG